MKMYHVTPAHNNESIKRRGLLRQFAKTADKAIYFVPRRWVEWAMRHVRERHRVEIVTVFYVDLKRRKMLPTNSGAFRTVEDVPPEQILGILCIEETV